MSTSVARDHQSPLEAALLDVHATLGLLLVAADDQYTAVAERDRERLEGVTRRQEQLAARLERGERRRIEIQSEVLTPSVSARVAIVRRAIAGRVRQLQQRHARGKDLIERSIDLNAQTLLFLHRLASPEVPTYGARQPAAVRRSVLVDSRA